jgi:hypothetical protein
MLRYLINGMAVGQIAEDIGSDRASVRGSLKDGGITLRPTDNGYALGRDSVCDAVKRAGYNSFHDFALVRSLDPITEQATFLSVSERSLARVYNAYRRVLTSLKVAGIALPT